MNDPYDVPLVDTVLLDELELSTNLIIAASRSDRHLTKDEIDALLGLPSGGIPAQVSRGPAKRIRADPAVRESASGGSRQLR